MQSQKFNLLKRDITINAISRCGKFRITAVSAPNILKETVHRHKLSSSSSSSSISSSPKFKWNPQIAIPLLGQVICFSNLTASWLSHEERVKSSFSTVQNGTFVSQSLALGETVSYIANRPVQVIPSQEGEKDVYEFDEDLLMSNGVLKVERIMYRQTTPILSATKWVPSAEEQKIIFNDVLDDENMNDALAPHVMNFFARSDGVPTAAFFFAHYDEKNLDQVYNGGVFVQAVAASAADVEDPKNDFDEHGDDNKNKIKLTAEREIEEFVLERCDFFSQISTVINHQKQVVEYSNEKDGENISAVFLNQLHRRALQGLLLQDLIGLATNDWTGAAKVCSKARHLTQKDLESDSSVEWAADIVTTPELSMLADKCFTNVVTEGIEKAKQGTLASVEAQEKNTTDEVVQGDEEGRTTIEKTQSQKLKRVRLDVESVKRTSIDFFCRCQKSKSFESFLKNSFKTSEEAIQFLNENPQEGDQISNHHYSCACCGAHNIVTDDDVKKLFIPEEKNDNNSNIQHN